MTRGAPTQAFAPRVYYLTAQRVPSDPRI